MFTIGPITGVSLNPARSFGSNVCWGKFYSDSWVFYVAPFVGALIGSSLYRFIFYKEKHTYIEVR